MTHDEEHMAIFLLVVLLACLCAVVASIMG